MFVGGDDAMLAAFCSSARGGVVVRRALVRPSSLGVGGDGRPPQAVAMLPLLGPVVTTVVSWLPTVLVGCLAVRLLNGRARTPGELPDIMVDAFRYM